MTGPLRCWRCKDRGFVANPCQVCGAFRVSSESEVVEYIAGSVWGDLAPPPQRKPRKRVRADRP